MKDELYEMGKSFYEQGKFQEAIACWDRIINGVGKDPKYYMVWDLRGAAKLCLGFYEEAIRDLDVALKMNAKNDFAWASLGSAKLGLGRYEEAIKDYKKALKLNPKSDYAIKELAKAEKQKNITAEKLSQQKTQKICDEGTTFSSQGKYAEAIECFDKFIRSDSKNYVGWQLRGSAKRMLSRDEEAIKDLNEAIKLNPKSYFAWAERGESNRRLGRYGEAIRDLNESIRLNSENNFAIKKLGEAKRQQEAEKNIAAQKSNQQKLENMVSELCRNGTAFYSQGKYAEAIECFDKILLRDSKYELAWQGRGESKRMLGRYEEAIQDLSEAIKLNPKSDYAWRSRGESKRMLGRYEEAIQDLNEAIKLNPNSDFAWQTRGSAKRMLGRNEEAIQDLNEAIRLNPKSDFAIKQLAEAKKQQEASENTAAQKLNQQKPEIKPGSLASTTSSPVFNHKIKVSMAIPKEQLHIEKRIGEGSFGEVHKGTWKVTSLYSIPVAIKQLKNASMSVKCLEDFKREVGIQSKLDSLNVVKLYGITAEQPYSMVMEFMEQGSLRDLLDAQKPEQLLWNVRIKMAIDMSKGLAYLHAQNPVIIHGDLKSLNVLVNAKVEAKLADFGLAALKTETRSKEYVGGNAEKNKGPKGSLLWIAPELFRMNAKRTTASDIFSLGIVFWELASHLFPYESANGNESLIREWVTSGEREAFDERTPNTPKEYIPLAQRCWDAKPENRPSAEKVAVHLGALYSKMPLAPTFFSSGSNPASAYMANTASAPVASKSNSGYLMKSVTPTTTSSQSASQQIPLQQVPPKGAYMGNVYK